MIFNRMKTGIALVAGTAMFSLAPLSASALGVSIVNVTSSGGSTALLYDGDILTFDLRLENVGNQDISGLSMGVFGYDQNNDGNLPNDRLRFVGGSVASSAFNTTLLPGPVAIGGIANTRLAPTQVGAGSPFNNPRRVQLFDGVALSPSNGDGSNDVGIGGSSVGSGDVHFRVSFRAVGGLTGPTTIENVTLTFGVGQFGNAAVGPDGSLLSFNNAQFTASVIPEPGTALLMGLGLAGLAASRRR